jgi:hypothetical protein
MIDKLEEAEKVKLSATTLVVCDAGGRVLAVSSGAAASGLFGSGAVQKHFAEIFGTDSAITSWLTKHLSEARRRAICEGDAIVTRQQWHDIKNHLGGLKLYATYLKRKLPEGEDQEISGKILTGVDALIDKLAKIRRGETQ